MINILPIEEQIKISDAADSIDNKILKAEKKMLATKHLKKALMQDLLTGKVRVKTD